MRESSPISRHGPAPRSALVYSFKPTLTVLDRLSTNIVLNWLKLSNLKSVSKGVRIVPPKPFPAGLGVQRGDGKCSCLLGRHFNLVQFPGQREGGDPPQAIRGVLGGRDLRHRSRGSCLRGTLIASPPHSLCTSLRFDFKAVNSMVVCYFHSF